MNPGDGGAIAENTLVSLTVRVAPGAISDPDLFWSSGLAGAIDLYTLTLQSDPLFNVDAGLVLGTSTADFLLNTSGTAAAEATIENAFAGNQGTLLADLMDIFAVGFEPQAGVSEYTVGFSRDMNVAAWEPVPEPAALCLLASGGLAVAAWRGRRRPRASRSTRWSRRGTRGT
jgi:hypothetical protein